VGTQGIFLKQPSVKSMLGIPDAPPLSTAAAEAVLQANPASYGATKAHPKVGETVSLLMNAPPPKKKRKHHKKN
jgi:hypothetical protein